MYPYMKGNQLLRKHKSEEQNYVNSREVWVETMVGLIDTGQIKPSARQIKVLADNWEDLLCRKYSNLN